MTVISVHLVSVYRRNAERPVFTRQFNLSATDAFYLTSRKFDMEWAKEADARSTMLFSPLVRLELIEGCVWS